ncbi:hypothetical protein AXF42_Ash016292 [Apostasia shenzhenica]|uniref:DUF4216 domain-containing protein n=1 Tax=Apostasia shenzhenica TaxID=1088818 RepID=A0A2H9ZXE1_9ASPA|nr:hypothetical protein AXF42_Ash016292 [Apostasia shenzhenica]
MVLLNKYRSLIFRFRVPIFLCKWVDSNGGSKIDDMGFTLVNLNRIGHKNNYFIFLNQATQVLCSHPSSSLWSIVLNCNPTFLMDDDRNDVNQKETFGFTKSLPIMMYDNSDDVPNYLIMVKMRLS